MSGTHTQTAQYSCLRFFVGGGRGGSEHHDVLFNVQCGEREQNQSD